MSVSKRRTMWNFGLWVFICFVVKFEYMLKSVTTDGKSGVQKHIYLSHITDWHTIWLCIDLVGIWMKAKKNVCTYIFYSSYFYLKSGFLRIFFIGYVCVRRQRERERERGQCGILWYIKTNGWIEINEKERRKIQQANNGAFVKNAHNDKARREIHHPQRLDLQWDKTFAVYRRSVSIS